MLVLLHYQLSHQDKNLSLEFMEVKFVTLVSETGLNKEYYININNIFYKLELLEHF